MSDPVWLIGGSNQVSAWLVPALLQAGEHVSVDSRTPRPAWIASHRRLQWRQGRALQPPLRVTARALVYIGPLEQFAHWWGSGHAVAQVIAFSSTSRFTKGDSPEAAERAMALSLAQGEAALRTAIGPLPLAILRPTLVYGAGLDQNLTRLAGWLRRLRLMPMPGPGAGLRQPVHAGDLARAVLGVLQHQLGGDYELSGGSTLTYREMIRRIFLSLDLAPRFFDVPGPAIGPGLWLLRRRRRWADVNRAMLQRIERDLVFSHAAAERDFGYHPRPFQPDAETWLRLHERSTAGT